MLLKTIELKRFRKFLNQRISFLPGFNIIYGPNESGKSTLRAALATALFGNPTSTSELTRALTTWGQSEKFELQLEYRDENNQDCCLRKDFATKKIFLIKDEESLRTFKSIQSNLLNTLGIPNEELFKLCASLDVRTLSQLGTQAERQQVSKMLAGMITGSDAGGDILQVLKKLKDALVKLNKGVRGQAVKSPGPIKLNQDKLLLLQGQKKQMEATLAAHRSRLDEYTHVTQQNLEIAQRLKNLEYLLVGNKKILDSERRLEELIETDSRMEKQVLQRREAEKSLAEITVKIESYKFGRLDKTDVEELRDIEKNIAALKEKIEVVPSEVKKNNRVLIGFGCVALFAGVVMFAYQWMTAVLLILGGIGMAWAGIMKQSQSRRRIQKETTIFEKNKQDYNLLEQKRDSIIAKTEYRTIEEIIQNWPEYRELQVRLNASSQHLRALPRTDDEQWKVIRRELRLTEDILQDSDLQSLKLSPREVAASQREYDEMQEKKQQLLNRANQLKALLDHEQVHQEAYFEFEEKIEVVESYLKRLGKQEKLLEKTHAFLDRARRDTLNPARKILEERASQLMAVFSEERYNNIAVDDEDLSCKILIPETETWESPQVLSQGTFDQFYLSLRLALSEILTNGKPAPVFLDEPLAAFDDSRTKAMLALLKEISKKRQILFFTCKRDYHSVADHVVDLSTTGDEKSE